MVNSISDKKLTTIALANIQEPLQQVLLSQLESQPSLQIIGKNKQNQDIISLVDSLKPDMLVVDLTSFNPELMDKINVITEKTKLITISGDIETGKVLRVLKLGAKAYLKIESAAREIVSAVREIAQGQLYLSQPLLEQAIISYLHKGDSSLNPYDFLTFQEKKVLRLIAYGYTKIDIADKLHLSERIVISIYDSIFRKLGGTSFGVGYS